MIRVYIAGPYSSDPGQNVQNALRAATELLDAGFAPYVPHLTHYWHAAYPRDYEVWMELDLEWLGRCDALLRLPGHSPGVEREVALAASLGIPVLHSVRAVCVWGLADEIPASIEDDLSRFGSMRR